LGQAQGVAFTSSGAMWSTLRLGGWLALALLPLAEGNGNCTLTKRPPRKARYLKFCQDYNVEACCIPGHDLENQVQFENLIGALGPGCKNPMMYPEIRFFYCMGCDPEQPRFTDEVSKTIYVCKSFLDKLWRDPAYDECGVMKSNDCPSNWVDEDFDPFMCGDTLVLPKTEYADAEAFINAFPPPGLDDGYTFQQVDDSVTGHQPCWIAKAYQSSGASSRLGGSLTAIALVALSVSAQWLL